MPDFGYYCEQHLTIVTFEPLAQTWQDKIIECRNNIIATSRRARAGLNPEPGTVQFSTKYFDTRSTIIIIKELSHQTPELLAHLPGKGEYLILIHRC